MNCARTNAFLFNIYCYGFSFSCSLLRLRLGLCGNSNEMTEFRPSEVVDVYWGEYKLFLINNLIKINIRGISVPEPNYCISDMLTIRLKSKTQKKKRLEIFHKFIKRTQFNSTEISRIKNEF